MSSREAARATTSTVSAIAGAGIVSGCSPSSGKLREVLGGEHAEVEARAAAADLDVALGLAQLDLDRLVAERAGELGKKAAGEEDGPGAVGLGLERRSAGPSPDRSREGDRAGVIDGDQDPGERLGRRAGGDSAGDDGEFRDKLVLFVLSFN